MSDKDRFEALMKLSDLRFARWQLRCKNEWRTSAGLWAILAAAVVYVKPTGTGSLMALAILLIAALIGHTWFWIRTNWISNELDILNAFYFAEHAEAIVLQCGPQPGKRHHPKEFEKEFGGWHFLSRGSCRFQVYATSLLALGLFAYLSIR